MALRGVAHADVPRECLATRWRRSRPCPKSRGVQSPARGSPWSLLRAGKHVARVLQHTVGCGMGQIQPHPGEEHSTGTEPAYPLHRDTQAAGTPFPALQLWGFPFVPHPIPAPLKHMVAPG